MENAAVSTPTQTPTSPQQEPAGNQRTQPESVPNASTAPVSQAKEELYEVTVNGQTKRLSLQQLKNEASKAHAAQEKFDEASKLRKENERFRETAKKDMIAALQDPSLGLTREQIRDEFEKWYTREFIEPETLSPDQRKLREYEQKLKKYQEEEEEKTLKARQEQEEQLTSKQREYLQGQIIDALDKSGLPKTKLIASRMAFYMHQNLLQGWEAPIDVIVQQVKEERQALMSGEVGSLDGEALINYLGNDVVDKIRRHDLAQLRARRQNLGQNSANNESSGGSEKIYSSEVARRLREMRTGRR